MKKILWFSSLTIIFLNMVIVTIFGSYPVINNILMNFSVLAIVFMVYVVFFEKKISSIIRNMSIVFGLAGLFHVVFNMISLHSFALNAVLAGILFITLVIVFSPVIIQNFLKD